MGSAGQRFRVPVFRVRHGVLRFSEHAARDGEHGELGPAAVGGRRGACGGGLSGSREEGIYAACCVCRGEKAGRGGASDGLRDGDDGYFLLRRFSHRDYVAHYSRARSLRQCTMFDSLHVLQYCDPKVITRRPPICNRTVPLVCEAMSP